MSGTSIAIDGLDLKSYSCVSYNIPCLVSGVILDMIALLIAIPRELPTPVPKAFNKKGIMFIAK